MIDREDLLRGVIIPTLRHLNLYSGAAEALLLGTFYTESTVGSNTHLFQLGNGPARSPYQIEPATHNDVWDNFLKYKATLSNKVYDLLAPTPTKVEQLVTNLGYATAISRVIYFRVPEPLPSASDYAGLARYWKQHYNTPKGAGDPAHFEYMLRAVLRD